MLVSQRRIRFVTCRAFLAVACAVVKNFPDSPCHDRQDIARFIINILARNILYILTYILSSRYILYIYLLIYLVYNFNNRNPIYINNTIPAFNISRNIRFSSNL